MDDSRIEQLTDEVLAQVREHGPAGGTDLEARVAALEAAVRSLSTSRAGPPTAVAIAQAAPGVHPSLRLLELPSGTPQCVLEPDKPCVRSGQCRTFGH